MSFTSIVKDEISKLETTKLEDISELSAIIRVAGNINSNVNVISRNYNFNIHIIIISWIIKLYF